MPSKSVRTGSSALLATSESETRSNGRNIPWPPGVSNPIKTKQNGFVSAPQSGLPRSTPVSQPFQPRQNSQLVTVQDGGMEQQHGVPTLTVQNQFTNIHLQNGHTFRNEAPPFTPLAAAKNRNAAYFATNSLEAHVNSQNMDRNFVPAESLASHAAHFPPAFSKTRPTNVSSWPEQTPAPSMHYPNTLGSNRNGYGPFAEPFSGREPNAKFEHSLANKVDPQMNAIANSFASMDLNPADTSQHLSAHSVLRSQARVARQPATQTYSGYNTLDSPNRTTSNGIYPEPANSYSQRASSAYTNGSYGQPMIMSPIANDYQNGSRTPVYSTSITPPIGSESQRSFSALSSRTSMGMMEHSDRTLRGPDPFAVSRVPYGSSTLQLSTAQPQPLAYDYNPFAITHHNPLQSQFISPQYANLGGFAQAARFAGRPGDSSHIIRSPLLEDFRANSKTNKRYELRDLYDHVVEFSGDQHGSRYIQQKLETANSDEKEQIFAEILPNSLQLMTDVFGNYVIQKLFEHGNQSQKKQLANHMKNHILSLSLQMYGCRVVQKALEHVLTDQQASIVKELESHVMRCVKDQNGNHVIQKAIERVPPEYIQFIVDDFHREVQRLATHPYGCRVIQRMLEHCLPHAKQSILNELHSCVPLLITDQFGNYVIQHVIENGGPEDRRRVVNIVQSQLLVYSKHKFASNVVEKSIEYADGLQKQNMLRILTSTTERGEGVVFGLMRDQYGNYVIRKSCMISCQMKKLTPRNREGAATLERT